MVSPQGTAPLFGSCQPWRGRRATYRPAGEPFAPSRYAVEPIPFAQAKAYVTEHHYSGSMPVSRLQLGLMHKASPVSSALLAGVIVLLVPVQERAIPACFNGLDPRLGIEIGRVVLDDSIPVDPMGA
jgi:hypothetical protein